MKPKHHPEHEEDRKENVHLWQSFNQAVDQELLPLLQVRCNRTDLALTVTTRGKRDESFDIAFTVPDLLTEQEIDDRKYEVLPWTKTLRKIMPSIFEGDRMHLPILYVGLYIEQPHLLSISTMTVDHDERGKGVGTAFEQTLRTWATTTGMTHITGEHHDEAAADFFVSRGWRLLEEMRSEERHHYPLPNGILRTVAFLNEAQEANAVLPRWKDAPVEERIVLSHHCFALRQWLQFAQEFVYGVSGKELEIIWPSILLLNAELPSHMRSDALEQATGYEARFIAFKALVQRIDLAEDECFGHVQRPTIDQSYAILLKTLERDGK